LKARESEWQLAHFSGGSLSGVDPAYTPVTKTAKIMTKVAMNRNFLSTITVNLQTGQIVRDINLTLSHSFVAQDSILVSEADSQNGQLRKLGYNRLTVLM
jgi:hypothetical protein